MNNFFIDFSLLCPHCNKPQEIELPELRATEGDQYWICTECANSFVLSWSLKVDAEVYKCDQETTECEVQAEIYEDEDMDIDPIEA